MAAKQATVTEIIGNYSVTCLPVKEGLFGQVMEAIHNTTNKKYIVKRIRIAEERKRAKKLNKMAKGEFEVNNRLKEHTNVLTVHEVIAKDGCFYIFMDYCDYDLEGFLAQNPDISFLEKVQLMHQASMAVACMHQQKHPIIHRDLNLKNILVKREGTKYIIKVADVGLLELFQEDMRSSLPAIDSQTAMLSGVGSSFFRAPEYFQEQDEVLKNDASVDTFALGLVFAVMLGGGSEHEDTTSLSGNLFISMNIKDIKFTIHISSSIF